MVWLVDVRAPAGRTARYLPKMSPHPSSGLRGSCSGP